MTAKRVVRSAFGTLSEARLLQPLVRRLALGRVNVVYYNFVGKTTSYYAEFYKGCTLERFQRDIATLRTLFEVVPLAKMIEFNLGMHAPEIPYLAVTFDDGFDLYRKEVLQILDEYKVKATTFVITSCLDNTNLMWRNKLSVIRATVDEQVYLSEYNKLITELGYREISRGAHLMAAAADWDMSRKDEWADELWKR